MPPVQKHYKTGTLAGVRQLNLYYQAWLPASNIRSKGIKSGDIKSGDIKSGDIRSNRVLANVVLVHGLGEHIGRYRHVAATFNQAGHALWAFDNLGHGRSDGQRGHIERWADYTENIGRFVAFVRQASPDRPLFIYGHSLGALMVLTYALKQPDAISGLVISGPPIQPVGVAKPWRVTFAKTFAQLLPRLSLNLGLGSEALSRDPKVIRRAKADSLMHSVATLRWGTETMDAIATVRQQIYQLQLPILMLHGAADQINDVKGSHELFEAMVQTDKTLLVYPDNYHELHNDLDKEQVLQDVLTWIEERLGRDVRG
ncbi:MAG: lysophospholipase [Cyanobacteria bacterium P01_A01_bin.105]